jgi:hypothetical protein
MPAVPAMLTQLNSSAGNTFSMSRWAMMLPIVARRSPAITTPPGKVAATMVVACGASTVAPAGIARRCGSSSGAWDDRNSVNDEEPTARNAAGSWLLPSGIWVTREPYPARRA